MKVYDHMLVYLPIAVAGAIVGVLAVYSIEMSWYQRIFVYVFGGVILLTGFIMSEKIKKRALGAYK